MNEGEVIDLWIRAGCDGLRSSGCPVGQQLFMLMLCKSEADEQADGSEKATLQFNVKTTNLHKPHEEFRLLGLRNLPALVHGNVKIEHLDEMLDYLDQNFPRPSLICHDPDAETAVKDIFSKFCFFIKDVNKDPKHLEHELRKIDKYLMKSNNAFISGDKLCMLDCEILPKLHHVRLACQRLKNYCVPADLPGFWRYMRNAYSSHIFKKSCPCDQEIILHWADRPDTMNLTAMEHKELSKQKPTFNFDTPSQT